MTSRQNKTRTNRTGEAPTQTPHPGFRFNFFFLNGKNRVQKTAKGTDGLKLVGDAGGQVGDFALQGVMLGTKRSLQLRFVVIQVGTSDFDGL